ncbi:acyl transferase/acyl hydrolase/lysophospholipase [Lipomyces kononenkoae]|uniref:Acyl transferase/acyl hydrolase/lysophospholipase n=1 Tax=Lipomyces kononenkoae TaxID=34357 RepID=A0ACC3T5Q1_LIPKO
MTMPTAFFFPGQASEAPAMLAPIMRHFPSIASDGIDAIQHALASDPDLPTIIRLLTNDNDNDKRLLHRTAIAQPCNLLAAILTWRVFLQTTKSADAGTGTGTTVFFGHSLGQITAFTAAGAITLVDALRIVRERGLAMEQVTGDSNNNNIDVPSKYGMLAVSLKNQSIGEFIKVHDAADLRDDPDQVVDCANFNSPSQVVLSGHIAALDKIAATELGQTTRKAATRYLPVRIPFHSRLLRPVESRVRAAVDNASSSITMPTSSTIHFLRNSNASPITTADDIRDAIVSGCWQPVDWLGSVRQVHNQFGVRRWIGIGPGSTITKTLVERCLGPDRAANDIVAFDPTKPGSAWDAIAAK